MSEPQHQWDQQPGESDQAYTRFLYYRNIGPTRSISKAFYKYSEEGGETQRSSGTWYAESSQWKWVARAHAYDVHTLQEVGRQAAIKLVHAIQAYATKVLDSLLDPKIRPENWEEACDALTILARFVPADTVNAIVRSDPRDGSTAPAGELPARETEPAA